MARSVDQSGPSRAQDFEQPNFDDLSIAVDLRQSDTDETLRERAQVKTAETIPAIVQEHLNQEVLIADAETNLLDDLGSLLRETTVGDVVQSAQNQALRARDASVRMLNRALNATLPPEPAEPGSRRSLVSLRKALLRKRGNSRRSGMPSMWC